MKTTLADLHGITIKAKELQKESERDEVYERTIRSLENRLIKAAQDGKFELVVIDSGVGDWIPEEYRRISVNELDKEALRQALLDSCPDQLTEAHHFLRILRSCEDQGLKPRIEPRWTFGGPISSYVIKISWRRI